MSCMWRWSPRPEEIIRFLVAVVIGSCESSDVSAEK